MMNGEAEGVRHVLSPLGGSGIKLRDALSWWKPPPQPGTELPGYPQMPLCGISGLAERGDEGSRGFQPPVCRNRQRLS
jgi:hypothetical protein